jgi:hypothetical protein
MVGLVPSRNRDAIFQQVKILRDYVQNLKIVKPAEYVVTVESDLMEVIDDYVRAVKADTIALGRALKERNFDRVYGIGHDLKGSGSGYGLDLVSEVGVRLCELARRQDAGGILVQVRKLSDFLKKMKIVAE